MFCCSTQMHELRPMGHILWERDVVESLRQNAEGNWPHISLSHSGAAVSPEQRHRDISAHLPLMILSSFCWRAAQSALSFVAFPIHFCLSRTFYPNLLAFKPLLSGWLNRTSFIWSNTSLILQQGHTTENTFCNSNFPQIPSRRPEQGTTTTNHHSTLHLHHKKT